MTPTRTPTISGSTYPRFAQVEDPRRPQLAADFREPMNVLQMGPYPPPHGGVQTNLVALRKYLLERGIACPAINLTRYRRADWDGVYYPQTALGVMKLLLELKYDVVHLHAGGDFSLRHAGVLLLCSLLPGKKTIFTFHSGGYPSSDAGRRAKPTSFRGFVLRRLHGLIAVNPELRDLFQRFGVPPERIRLIPPHSVETPAVAPLPPPLEEFFRAHDPLLVTISGLEPEYDLPLQLEAVGRLHPQFPGIGLAIIGGGSLEDDIRHRIAAAPHGSHIRLCGDLPHEDALRALSRSALFLRTTHYDGDSISVREALHLGVPVIATDNGMRPPGVHLVPISNLDALVSTTASLLISGKGLSAHPPQSSLSAPALTGLENLEAVVQFYRDLASPPSSD
jgi:glycosyltransferase involved in cell wall biosynthesis